MEEEKKIAVETLIANDKLLVLKMHAYRQANK